MSRKPISMRKIKEVLRLKWECSLTDRQIADSCKIGRTTVQEYVSRARAANLTFQHVQNMSEDDLEQNLFPGVPQPCRNRPSPNWDSIHVERKKPGVTLMLLWEEYRQAHPDGYSYSQFCDSYKRYSDTLEVTLRQSHKAGDKLFLDYSGKRIEVVDPKTGEVRAAEIFVAVLGASNYTYAEATWSQTLRDWIGSHVQALEYFGGVPACLVPDNLKSGVSKPWYYDPDINPTYMQFAEHYGTAVLPARSRKPRDKAKVEAGVLLVQRWILACLRHRRFFSLGELNTAIWQLLEKLNHRPFKKMPGSRRSLFESIDKPALRPLPTQAYEYAEWKHATVNIDYHVVAEQHYYSVPYSLARKQVEVRVTATCVEIFHRGTRVASHMRSCYKGQHSTIQEHMPPQHAFVQWSPERFLRWAEKCGPQVVSVVEGILKRRHYPEQGYREILGILRLAEKLGKERLNAACSRAMHFGSPRYKTVATILKNNQDRLPLPDTCIETPLPEHDNVRGPDHYNQLVGGSDASATSH